MQFSRNRQWIWILAVIGGFILSASAKPYGLDSRPNVGAFLNGAIPETAPAISGNWSAVVAFPNLLFTNAVGLTFVPTSNQLCVWEREGRVWTFENSPNIAQKKLILDIHDQCQGWDDSGLLGVAFHPGFATNRFVFVYYTAVKSGSVVGDPNTRPNPVLPNTYHDRLSRFTLDENGITIPNSETILIDQTNQTVWHDGGGMFFHPQNGFLYLTIGDNSVGDNDQIINKSLFSGVFRIDVDCRGGNISHPISRQPLNGVTTNYFIPNDNPFVGQTNVLEEFFCLGLRSPHRMTIDPPTGRIFIGDVGESSREEIDVIETNESGLNFQWNKIEGNQGHLKPPFIGIDRPPILDYSHSDGRAVIGGYIYRGKKFTDDLVGKYIFGDNVMRTIWAMDETTTPVKKTVLCVMPKGEGPNSGTDYTGLSSFGTDADGEIYFCQMSSIGGRIFTLARGGPPPPTHPIPKLLSQTGAFADLKDLMPQDFLIPYSVNSPLWSDGAIKSRWIALPQNSKIHFWPNGEWQFPAGTVFMKNFSLPIDDTNPNNLRRLETRLLVRDADGTVYGASYKWRADNSDADLVNVGITEPVEIKTATGTRIQNWFFPGRQDCLTCHTPQSGGVLGVKTRQLNGDFKYPNGVTDNQLRAWSHAGLFDVTLTDREISRFEKLVSVTDTRASLELRARSYLDANCAQCHRPGVVEAFFDARFDTPLKNQNLINGPVANQFGLPGAKVIVPGDTNRAILFRRMSLTGNLQMPPLAKNVVDEKAAAVLAEWIQSLRAKPASLPKNWSHADIGSVGLKGEANYLNGQFNLLASGADIWENADAFHFACTPLDGDGQIVARITSLQITDPWAKAGVMFRETLSPGSRYALMAVTAQGSSVYQSRTVENNLSSSSDGLATKMPQWLKLVRAGNIFTGYVSANGENWQRVSSVTNSMPQKIYIGLAVTAHNNSALNSTLFDNVAVSKSQ
ncbi:MAG TPA: PQQ-dependent sugar dehydrogenase [Methylomirabilota bacterium]|nr:PQQ-dependent sugar dehydrogenase [Methylomirabilota bacterium]